MTGGFKGETTGKKEGKDCLPHGSEEAENEGRSWERRCNLQRHKSK